MRPFLRLRPLAGVKLRGKLTLAFLCLSLLVAICGASSLVFVYRIGGTLSVFTDVTSPLLSEMVTLGGNARRMRAVFLQSINQSAAPAGESSEDLGELDLLAIKTIAKIRQLLKDARLSAEIDEIERLQQEYLQGLQTVHAAHTRQQITRLACKSGYGSLKKSDEISILSC